MTYDKVKLEDVCIVNQGLQIPIANRLKSPGKNRYFYITVQFLKNNVENWYIENPPETVICDVDDILMVRTGSTGRVVTGVKGCFHNNFFIVRPKPNINNRFLYYSLDNENMYKKIMSVASGTTIPDLKHSSFYKLDIHLPLLEEQKVIANTLSSLDDKIENNNKINENLEEQAQSIFKHWFVDFEFPDENGKPYKSSGGEMVESELGMIPKGWEVIKLGDKFKFVKGKVPKYVESFEEKAQPYLNKAALDGNWNDIKYGLESTGVFCRPMDILMMMDGSSSGQILYGYKGLVGSTLSLIDIRDDNMREVLYMYFTTFNDEIRNQNTGSAIPHANKDYINNMKIAVPISNNVFSNLSSIFNTIRLIILSNREQNEKISQLRDTLLPKLMSGEIRIPLD